VHKHDDAEQELIQVLLHEEEGTDKSDSINIGVMGGMGWHT
jgi:hypothetical protein